MNREEEKLCLKWNDFQENAIYAFGTLREDREFADVTLACEDGQQVEAHKVILASSSPFFLNLLIRNKHPHPLIYMRGLKSENLVAIVDFLYFGEANVSQENLDSFLALAAELQMKGLTESGSGAEKEVEENEPQPLLEVSNKKKMINTAKQEHHGSIIKTKNSHNLETTLATTDNTLAADLQDLDDKIKSMMMFSENHAGGAHGRARICKVCGKEGQMYNIRKHIKANHITGVYHSCHICGKIAMSSHALAEHNSRYHEQ